MDNSRDEAREYREGRYDNQEVEAKAAPERLNINDVGVWFQSTVSSMWYENYRAAGDIQAVRVDGVSFRVRVDPPSAESLADIEAEAREIAERYVGGISSQDILNRKIKCAEAIARALSTREAAVREQCAKKCEAITRAFRTNDLAIHALGAEECATACQDGATPSRSEQT